MAPTERKAPPTLAKIKYIRTIKIKIGIKFISKISGDFNNLKGIEKSTTWSINKKLAKVKTKDKRAMSKIS